jgi:hypothetical protein
MKQLQQAIGLSFALSKRVEQARPPPDMVYRMPLPPAVRCDG